jgi:DHA1 family bicyclomycin/chloramphenicol resistance-like MFS transporter
LRIAPKSFAFTMLLGLLAALPALSIDISAPTLVLLPQALNTSLTVAGLTLSLFMAGFALGQLGGGRLSDRSGRRPVLLTGLICFTAAGVGCALARSGPALLVFRLVQGIGAGACSVLAFAMVQDLFEGNQARSKRSYVTVVFGIVPMFAPALGAWLVHLAGWRAVHGVLAVAGAGLIPIIWWGVPESLRESMRGEPQAAGADPGPAGRARLRDDRQFISFAAVNALSYGAIFAYIAGSPTVVIGQMGLSASVYAGLFACTAAALAAGAWTSGRLSRHGVAAAGLLGPNLTIAAGAALALAVTCIGLAGVTARTVPVALLLVILFSRGVTAPSLQHLAIERQRERAGTASAAIGVSQLVAGALTSAAVAVLLPHLRYLAVAAPMAALTAIAAALWWWTRPPMEVAQ